ncbi:MAG: hypothetical protein SVR94_20015 [Pseudomonadota bacterium]|nr:hypothetical protein [Pseudomonadota bacterium]
MNDKDLIQIIDSAIDNFSGNSNELAKAIGMLTIGRKFGWKVLYLIHSKNTIRKYEKILSVDLREVLPEVGPNAHKSLAWRAVQKVGNFWKAVKGEIPGVRSAEIDKSKPKK